MNTKIKKITTIGMLCAMTYVIMAVGSIPVVLFLKYDPSDVIVTLGGLIWGPMTSCIVSVIVATIEMITVSDTGILGCIMNIVQTVSFPAHDLPDTLLPEPPLVLLVLVLPALIRLKNQVCSVRDLCKRLVRHGCHHTQRRTIRDSIADQIAAVLIENRGQIQFLPKPAELGHIRNPFLIRLVGMEILIQQI